MLDFVHLHCHSEFSPDGMGNIEDLITHVANIGQKALAITDHGTLGNLVQHWLQCKKHGIKPIFGCEFYLRYKEDKTNHITILAKTKDGLNNLIELSNASQGNMNRGKPCITPDMMVEYSADLITLTGCPASALFMSDYNVGYEYVDFLVNTYGRNSVFGELMFTMDDKSLYVDRVLQVCNDLAIKPVITNDCHFAKGEYAPLHPKLTVARKGFDYSSSELYVKTGEEMKTFAMNYMGNEYESLIDDALTLTNTIADSVEKIDLANEPQLPHITDEEYSNMRDYLLNKLRNDGNSKERIDRFELEYGVFESKKFLDYLYIIYDLALFCQRENIFVSLRGSGGGSYLIYLLGIADIDPIQYGLLFERFLNISRSDYPDVDLDIETLQRDKVLEYLNKRWGMVGVSTYSRYSHKSLIHDIFRVFDIDSVPGFKDISKLERLICEYDNTEDCEPFQVLAKEYPEAETFYNVCIGQIRQRGQHAGAVGSTNTTIKLPLENGIISLTEGNDKELSKIGVVKIDILGIRELDRQRMMYNLTGVMPPKNPEDYPLEMFQETFQKGKMLGFFQVDASDGIRSLTKAIKPTHYNDIVAAISLYRPGALDAGTAQIYAELKENGQRTIHPEIDAILKDTYGVIIYQEQVMSIYALITGTGLLGADLARRILSPKSAKKLTDPDWIKEKDAVEVEYMNLGIVNSWNKHLLDEVWKELLTHTRYSFNRSHAAAYAFHAIKDAWYLHHYPTEYYTALLQVDKHNGNLDAQKILYYAVQDNIPIELPHINVSTDNYELKDKKIYLPLQTIYRLSDKGVVHIIETREMLEDRMFATLEDFKRLDGRKVNKSTLRRLYQIGGLPDIQDITKVFKVEEIPDGGFEELQFDAMQFVIPNKFIVDKIEGSIDKQYSAIGFVKSHKTKKTKNGHPYLSYNLHPMGNFWTYVNENSEPIPAGTFVGVKYMIRNNRTFGLAESVYRLPYTEDEFNKVYMKFKERFKLYGQ
jgi:DNA polymerase-3 subunit alpha